MARKKVSKRTKKVTPQKSQIDKILAEHNQGIKLDIGCGANKQGGDFVGMDVRAEQGVDIVHNLEQFPWPLPDECASMCVASHVLEHINPANSSPQLAGLIKLLKAKGTITDAEIREYIGEYEVFGTFIRFMDEVWRVTKPGGRFAFVVPYAGSWGFWQDPTHLNPITENTLAYFDPLDQSGLYYIYRPKPWKIVNSAFDQNAFLEVILEKRLIDKSYGCEE